MTRKDWRIGVAGLGTVGAGLLTFLSERPDFAPAGGRASITGVSARSRSRPRPYDISNLPWFDDPVALAASPDNDRAPGATTGQWPAQPIERRPGRVRRSSTCHAG